MWQGVKCRRVDQLQLPVWRSQDQLELTQAARVVKTYGIRIFISFYLISFSVLRERFETDCTIEICTLSFFYKKLTKILS